MTSVLNEENTEIIVAGPGVGKTTALLDRIEEALAEGVAPDEIAFFSFSTTAVNEGLDRITSRLKYKRSQFKYFKTLHAMAFSLLGFSKKQVVSYSHMNQFAKDNDLKLSSMDFKTGITKYQTKDSILLSQIDSARLLGMSIREFFVAHHIEDVTIARAEDLAARYQKFKLAQGIIDFTDMILLANQSEFETPPFKYMFIDEAQDLSTQQWKFVEKLAVNTEKIVVVGDEKQAIAEYAGADVDYFLDIKGKMTTLDKSYRVPRVIYNLARRIEKFMIKKRDTIWHPRDLDFKEETPGEIIRISDLPIREMARGSWLILTRTNTQLDEFKNYLMRYCETLPAFFLVDNVPPVDPEVFKAITIFEAVSISDKVTKYDFIMPDDSDTPAKLQKKLGYVKLLKKFMSSKAPGTPELDSVFMHRFNYKNWYDAFDRVSIPERKYIAAIRKGYNKNPNAFADAKIKLSTIHSAKGMEADNVVLYTALSGKVYNEWQRFKETNDTEAKVLFVAVTRARKKLYLMGRHGMKYSYKEMLE